MYESPISLVIDQLATELATAFDKEVLTAFRRYHIDIDKDELIKALAYDRGQYEKGYTDGLMAERWTSVEDRLPEETESMFARFHGTEKWDNAMWLKESKQVIVAIEFTDGGKRVTLGRLHDGEWHTTVSVILPHTVTHWMPLPEPPEEVEQDG